MRLYSKWQWCAIGLITLAGCVLSVPYTANNMRAVSADLKAEPEAAQTADMIANQPHFYDLLRFTGGLSAARRSTVENDIDAVLVPHHLLASPLIAEGIKRASGRPIDTVVIIGPNHEELGPSVMTTDATWETPVGSALANQRLVNQLAASQLASSNAEGFRYEHSIGAIMPFVKHYIPDAQVLPIILRHDTGDEVAKLAQWLDVNLPPDSLIVYSVDFSHYLNEFAADDRDAETEHVLRSGDIGKLLQLGHEHVDSPATLAMALEMSRWHNSRMEIVKRANSNDFLQLPNSETTSYLEIIWR